MMPSLFPGMDLYMENVIHWGSIHTALIAYITATLNDALPDAFVAHLEGRPFLFEYTTQEVEERFVTILSVDNEEVVAVIEVLSPTNKASESTERDEYLRKQREVLRSSSHLLEIDLLRGGAHTVAIGREAVLAQTQYDYLACLHRAGGERKSRFAVWAWSVPDVMPTIMVPLLPGFADVPLDLQAV